MFLKRKWVLNRWVAMFFLGVSLAALWANFSDDVVMTTTTPEEDTMLEVVVDAGHGGFDGGAVSADGIEEKGINLAISQKLGDLLTICGATVYQTRTEDEALHGNTDNGDNAKRADIKARLAMFDEHPNALVVSVHQNHYTSSQYWGAQMFYGVKNEESPLLAEAMQQRFYQLQPENTRLVKEGPTSVYLLQQTNNVMVLAECGFLSNPEETALLCEEEYQTQVAFSIFGGIADYKAGGQTPSTELQVAEDRQTEE